MIPALWAAAMKHGINPVVLIAQSAHETGWGNYRGVVDASFHNTCGLKKSEGGGDSDPDAHARFPDWATGARAHAQHLYRYTGGVVAPEDIVDPRYGKIGPPFITRVTELGGRWAPASDYGAKVEDVARRLIG